MTPAPSPLHYRIREEPGIELHLNNMNKEDDFCLSKPWKLLICSLSVGSLAHRIIQMGSLHDHIHPYTDLIRAPISPSIPFLPRPSTTTCALHILHHMPTIHAHKFSHTLSPLPLTPILLAQQFTEVCTNGPFQGLHYLASSCLLFILFCEKSMESG
jgi:hypothetical protein